MNFEYEQALSTTWKKLIQHQDLLNRVNNRDKPVLLDVIENVTA